MFSFRGVENEVDVVGVETVVQFQGRNVLIEVQSVGVTDEQIGGRRGSGFSIKDLGDESRRRVLAEIAIDGDDFGVVAVVEMS